MKNYILIMAGGSGTRLWPLSRVNKPKQSHQYLNYGYTLDKLVETVSKVVPKDQIYFSVGQAQLPHVRAIFPYEDHIILQPEDRNNAPAILQAALSIQDPDCTLTLLPSDQIITHAEHFHKALLEAIRTAKTANEWCAIGTKPLYPATGFGYLQVQENTEMQTLVERFVEKPSANQIMALISDQNILWNTGIYAVPIKKLFADYQRYLPKLSHELISFHQDGSIFRDAYGRLMSISVDHGIIERLDRLYCIKSDHEWMDVGTFEFMEHFIEADDLGNTSIGDFIGVDSHHNSVYSDHSTLVAFGVQDLLIVQTKDVTLICPKSYAQGIRTLVDSLKTMKRNDIL